MVNKQINLSLGFGGSLMIKSQLQLALFFFLILNSVFSNSVTWPEFMGPKRNGLSSEIDIFNKKNIQI